MTQKISRRRALAAISSGALAPLFTGSSRLAALENQRAAHASYRLEFRYPLEELIGDLLNTERGDPRLESETPHAAWYSHEVRRRLQGWGPKPRHYPPLAGLKERPVEWRRERVIATAARFLGYGYQHHHIPDWDPPADWPWKKTCVGHNGKGVDCSNFTSFVYNQGFGIKMTSAVESQSQVKHALEGGHESIAVRRIELPRDYAARQGVLHTGDLLYIRGREEGPITHVVIWVGAAGRAASGVPLVMDSHGAGVNDDEGQPIPCGVQLRPFRDKSWYNRCASHAHRIFGGNES